MERSREINTIGEVTSITYPAHGSSTHLDVIISLREDDDAGSENLLLRFLGRRSMACLEIGSLVRVHGTLSSTAGTPIVFNPTITVMAGE